MYGVSGMFHAKNNIDTIFRNMTINIQAGKKVDLQTLGYFFTKRIDLEKENLKQTFLEGF